MRRDLTSVKTLRTGALRTSTAFAFAGALALTGCGGGLPQSASLGVGPSATASPSPTLSAARTYKPASTAGPAENVAFPTFPSVARTETKEGAEAFARYWVSLLNYGYETGDVDAFQRLAHASCPQCRQLTRFIQEWHADGGWLVGGKAAVPVATTTFRKGADGNYQVALQIRYQALTRMRADGTVAQKSSRGPDQGYLLIVRYQAGAWSAVELGRIVG